ncbi:hypothetical protein TIFTF001_055211 [Ficus carica]|uniref:Uncharacterized protein n=1 Tax=Ficus carica TaxID=3494 RepID=A0AA88JHD8_FICCA|nr:hypothetical protein TIFTF001_055211 [Ficus carica]
MIETSQWLGGWPTWLGTGGKRCEQM